MDNQDFIKILDKKTQEMNSKFIECCKQVNFIFYSVSFEVPLPEDVKTSFGLNDNIKFLVHRDSEGNRMEYLYKDMVVKPESYYILPSSYTEVSTLRILQECVHQNTNKPDIKQIQDGTIK